MATWRAVKSNKPLRKGEAFVMNGDQFVLKVYKDSVPDTFALAKHLAELFQRNEDRRATHGPCTVCGEDTTMKHNTLGDPGWGWNCHGPNCVPF